MMRSVELPIWLLVLILLFAAVTFASHFLFPSVRWFFRRRMERAVSRLNERLERPIQPFKLATRHDMIQRLIYDPAVLEAVTQHAREEGVPDNVAFEMARRYAREIVPSFSASVYFGVAIRLARWLSRTLYRVHLDDSNEAALAAIDGDATIVFVMNHRSNMDYVLITYLVAERSALSYAVGEWARVWPLSGLIRAMGAYFIRRKSRNQLYRRVLARYVQLATRGGVTQAVFPEGRLSLDGAVGAPKLGLLSYVLADFDPDDGKDVVFVPVALNYDRVLEDRILTQAAKTGRRKFRASVIGAIWFGIRYFCRRLFRRAVRFGHAGVAYGAPLSLSDFLRTKPSDPTEELGQALRDRVQGVMPVLPVPIVAHVLQRHQGSISRADLIKELTPILHRLNDLSPQQVSEWVDQAVAGLVTRRIIADGPGGLSVMGEGRALLAFYARSVAHFFEDEAVAIGFEKT